MYSHRNHQELTPATEMKAADTYKDAKRPLGLGFGLGITFIIFYFQQLRMLINPVALDNIASKREELQEWIKRNEKVTELSEINNLMGKDDITSILHIDVLDEIINDVLDDKNVVQLSKRFPSILQNMENNIKALFSKTENIEKFRDTYLKSWKNYANLHEIMKKTLKKGANLPDKPNHPLGTFNMFLEKLQSQNQTHFPSRLPDPTDENFIEEMKHILSIENISRINPIFMVTLIPIILYHMDKSDRAKIAIEIAKRLPPKFFQIAAEENYTEFKQIENHDELLNVSIDTTGRAIVFRPQKNSMTSLYQFRGKKTWKINHIHIHFELEGEESEYSLHPSEESLEQAAKNAKAGIKPAINKEAAGEVHIVLERTSSKKEDNEANQRLMALGFILKINSDPKFTGNPELAKLLEQYAQNQEISFNIQKAFMPNLDEAQKNNLVIDSSWASTESPKHAFRAGLRFLVVLPNGELKTSVEVSEDQYRKLREIFNSKNIAKFAKEDIDSEIMMTNLPSSQALHPYGRSPGM